MSNKVTQLGAEEVICEAGAPQPAWECEGPRGQLVAGGRGMQVTSVKAGNRAWGWNFLKAKGDWQGCGTVEMQRIKTSLALFSIPIYF